MRSLTVLQTNMKAFEFTAYDISGCKLMDVTDKSTCIWTGTEEQLANAEMQLHYFGENESFYRVNEPDYEPE